MITGLREHAARLREAEAARRSTEIMRLREALGVQPHELAPTADGTDNGGQAPATVAGVLRVVPPPPVPSRSPPTFAEALAPVLRAVAPLAAALGALVEERAREAEEQRRAAASELRAVEAQLAPLLLRFDEAAAAAAVDWEEVRERIRTPDAPVVPTPAATGGADAAAPRVGDMHVGAAQLAARLLRSR